MSSSKQDSKSRARYAVGIIDIGSSSIRATIIDIPLVRGVVGFSRFKWSLSGNSAAAIPSIVAGSVAALKRAIQSVKEPVTIVAIGLTSFACSAARWTLQRTGDDGSAREWVPSSPMHSYSSSSKSLQLQCKSIAPTDASQAEFYASTGTPVHPAYIAPFLRLQSQPDQPAAESANIYPPSDASRAPMAGELKGERMPPASQGGSSGEHVWASAGSAVAASLAGSSVSEIGISVSEAAWWGLWESPAAFSSMQDGSLDVATAASDAVAGGPNPKSAMEESPGRMRWHLPLLRACNANIDDLPTVSETYIIRDDCGRPIRLAHPEVVDALKSNSNLPSASLPILFRCSADGAAAAIGSGCLDLGMISATVGTSAAIRQMIKARRGAGIAMPSPSDKKVSDAGPSVLGREVAKHGMWMYQVTHDRFLLGGALTDGGSMLDWVRERMLASYSAAASSTAATATATAAASTAPTVRAPDAESASPKEKTSVIELQEHACLPNASRVACLPFLHSERSTGWNSEASMSMIGIRADTSTMEIAFGAMQAVCFRMRAILDGLESVIGSVQTSIDSKARRIAIGSGTCLETSSKCSENPKLRQELFLGSKWFKYVSSYWSEMLATCLRIPVAFPMQGAPPLEASASPTCA